LNSSVYCARFALTVIVSSPCLSLHTQQEIRFSGARSVRSCSSCLVVVCFWLVVVVLLEGAVPLVLVHTHHVAKQAKKGDCP
ncbi:hypothetical protein, partial [Paraburkholderia nemoris]|uniref:hypothetical protein n=1 Tax=Paraburkholderia nemoris TaxID=2793076 RepID=UPI001B8CA768